MERGTCGARRPGPPVGARVPPHPPGCRKGRRAERGRVRSAGAAQGRAGAGHHRPRRLHATGTRARYPGLGQERPGLVRLPGDAVPRRLRAPRRLHAERGRRGRPGRGAGGAKSTSRDSGRLRSFRRAAGAGRRGWRRRRGGEGGRGGGMGMSGEGEGGGAAGAGGTGRGPKG